MLILLRLAEDVITFQTLPTQRRRDIQQTLTQNMDSIFSFMMTILHIFVEDHRKVVSRVLPFKLHSQQIRRCVESWWGCVAVRPRVIKLTGPTVWHWVCCVDVRSLRLHKAVQTGATRQLSWAQLQVLEKSYAEKKIYIYKNKIYWGNTFCCCVWFVVSQISLTQISSILIYSALLQCFSEAIIIII